MASVSEPTCDAKVVIIGDTCVGKTCIARRFVSGQCEMQTGSTIGASFLTKRLYVDDVKMKLQIWDTAGQERFRSMVPMYYRGASAALLVYDVTEPESFESIKDWAKELRANVSEESGGLGKNIVIALVGNKMDLQEERMVSTETGKQYANEINALFGETSAKQNKGINELFDQLLRKVLRRSQGYITALPTDRSKSSASSASSSTQESCCS